MKHPHKLNHRGFTIVELMIATTVLSVLILIVTIVIINIGNLYYKGISSSRLQDNVRALTDEVSQKLELSGTIAGSSFLTASPVTSSGGYTMHAYCIGDSRYFFVTGVQIGTIAHVLWRDINPEPGACNFDVTAGPPPVPQVDLSKADANEAGNNNGVELIAPRSRLAAFSITSPSPYTIQIVMAYGDNDLLCSPSVNIGFINSCNTPVSMTTPAQFSHADLKCRGRAGDSFCATAGLTVLATQRLD